MKNEPTIKSSVRNWVRSPIDGFDLNPIYICILTTATAAVKIKIKMHVTANLRFKHEYSFILLFLLLCQKGEQERYISLCKSFW